MKKALITLSIIAGILAVITFFVVFYGGSGSYVVTSNGTPNASTTNVFSLPTTTPSSTTSTAFEATSTATSTAISGTPDYTATYSSPVITWNEGRETVGIMGASLAGNQLTLTLQVAMGPAAECVPLNLRLVANESGLLAPPTTPQFTFPESGSCEGAPGATYNDQAVTFTADPSLFPVFITTGGTSNVYFQVSTTTNNGIQIMLPSTQG